ncbi:hypothetical protein ERO13_D07G202850v2 [Gossypium hirsutum]|nr:hypothetical protein ERO13_D07G202850v2 [Gossypium hirsutum]
MEDKIDMGAFGRRFQGFVTLCRSWSLDGGVFLPTILNWQSCSEEKKVDFTFSPLLFFLALGGLIKTCTISQLLDIYLMCGKAICLFSGLAMK